MYQNIFTYRVAEECIGNILGNMFGMVNSPDTSSKEWGLCQIWLVRYSKVKGLQHTKVLV
ncbi:hypothetical protein APHNP_0179 [Anaplasma phagocytophilum str. ApNP]|uniref:Uncharacterized protein n=2 Tax=Anaplasma phagocytophilum TaxID=948 RepID=A0A0F3NF92_ANAPH|nr:hypothetical protein APHMUC_0409 [Anaplasma phagocytophilum str. ApMUC09]KJV66743.1 hypothetical protein APHNP_0179 [Anaplasma phagocytophilum str. ApNP]